MLITCTTLTTKMSEKGNMAATRSRDIPVRKWANIPGPSSQAATWKLIMKLKDSKSWQGLFKGKSKHYVDLKLQFFRLSHERQTVNDNKQPFKSIESIIWQFFFFGFFSVETFAMNQQSKFQGWFWVHQNMSQFHVSVCDPLPLIQFVSFIFAVKHKQ